MSQQKLYVNVTDALISLKGKYIRYIYVLSRNGSMVWLDSLVIFYLWGGSFPSLPLYLNTLPYITQFITKSSVYYGISVVTEAPWVLVSIFFLSNHSLNSSFVIIIIYKIKYCKWELHF